MESIEIMGINRSEYPTVYASIEKLSKNYTIDTLQVAIISSASQVGASVNNRLSIPRQLLDQLTEGELDFIIGHELSHIEHKDMQTATMICYAGFIFISYPICSMTWALANSQTVDSGPWTFISYSICFLACLLSLKLYTHLSRKFELRSDMDSIIANQDCRSIITALDKCDKISRKQLSNPAFLPIYVLSKIFILLLGDIHPSNKKRIENARKLGEKLRLK